MTPNFKGGGPLFNKCGLDTLTFHLNPFWPTFLFKKAPTKPKTLKALVRYSIDVLKIPLPFI